MPKRVLETPNYEIVGDLQRMDWTDTVIARHRLVPDSDSWQAFYQKHPDLEARGRKWAELQASQPIRTQIPPQDGLMVVSMYSVIQAMSAEELVTGEPAPNKIVIDPERASEKIKGLARQLGAEMVGIGPLNQAWTYGHVTFSGNTGDRVGSTMHLPHQHAVVVALHYKKDDIDCAPHLTVPLATLSIYIRLCGVVLALAQYIRSLGYNARAHTPFNTHVLDVPIAADAGLGQLGRSGILITEEYGSNFKPMSITTDMPLAHDKPIDIGVDEICSSCTICATVCPSGAIPRGDKKVIRGVRKWKINEAVCFEHWLNTASNCSLCIAYCPLSQPHTSAEAMAAPSDIMERPATKGDAPVCCEKKQQIPSWLEPYPELWREFLKPKHPFYREKDGS